ncbi:MAG: Gfo/Idh/MocA family oxidoreductase [Syntrophaceae bacterium]|jgi:predicted dehydrogenase|nr:Gfo/Idh/MocA family oxidoreductase [Syntrophaceae bacterium]HOC59573.1 Gfo/Idh/MocA family oxidoreductase [Smithellaceae bacterium]HQM45391.1 Gfo/Idh/MocA family oxidoreductase [Smithellaceae bacterium]
MSQEKKIRIGVVGIGHLGNYHLQKYARIDSCKIVAVADPQSQRAQKAAELYGCEAFTHHQDMLGLVDAVSIAVPTDDHYAVAKDFLAAGVDTLVEKPLCISLEQADELLALQQENQRILQVGFVERFNPAILALEKVITRPVFVEVHRLHPFFERGIDVDVVLDLMIHDLDLILKFVNAPLLHVEAVGVPILSDKIDISNVRLSFAGGCIANITASRISAKTMQKIRFFGPEGYHSVDCQKREILSLSKIATSDGKQQIVQNNMEVGSHDPLEEEIRSFVHSVLTRVKPVVSGEEGRQALALAVQILQKMKTQEDFQ